MMNVDLLRRIQAKIRKTPTSFYMSDWITDPDSMALKFDHFTAPECGTVACIGGWAALMTFQDRHPGEPMPKDRYEAFKDAGGTDALNLDWDQEQRLFYVWGWPEPFQSAYSAAVDAEDFGAAAKIACDRIDQFIATDGAQ